MVSKYVNKNAKRTLIMLHGSGGDENSLIGLANMILPSANILSIRGTVTQPFGFRYFRLLDNGKYDLKNYHENAIKLAAFINEAAVKYQFDLEEATLIGFSNGANIILGMLQYQMPSIKQIALLSPAYINPSQSFSDLNTKKIFLTIASNDQYETREMLKKLENDLINANAQVTSYHHNDGHTISENGLLMLKKWLN